MLQTARHRVDAAPVELEEQFRDWYETHFDYVWRSLRRLGANRADLGDLAQEVFVVAWRRKLEIDPKRPLKPWLFGVAVRVAANHRRLSWLRRRNNGEPPPTLADPGLSPEQQSITRAELEALDRALRRLPMRHRALLLLHDFDEVPMDQASAALGIATKTGYSRLAAARRRFRQVFRQQQLNPNSTAIALEPSSSLESQ